MIRISFKSTLTLALSLRERELTVRDFKNTDTLALSLRERELIVRDFKNTDSQLPLPQGEGWGEGAFGYWIL